MCLKNLKKISIAHRSENIKAIVSAGTSSRFVAWDGGRLGLGSTLVLGLGYLDWGQLLRKPGKIAIGAQSVHVGTRRRVKFMPPSSASLA